MDSATKHGLEAMLKREFGLLNSGKFDGKIEDYRVRFSGRSVRTHGSIDYGRKTIMVSIPLLEQYGWDSVRNTLLHEMTHAFIHQQGGHNRHTKRFWREFVKRGGVRDSVDVKPRRAYVYACKTCGSEFSQMRRIRKLRRYSCLKCDKNYNPQHKLVFKGEATIYEPIIQ